MSLPSVSCVIPARLQSTRFPRKLLAPLSGAPVIAHTIARALQAECFAEVICLTDSPEIAQAAEVAGCKAELTGAAANGTERIALNLKHIANELIVNLQGDEPIFPIEALRALCQGLMQQPHEVHTVVWGGSCQHFMSNPNLMKALVDEKGYISQFFRTPPVGYNSQWGRAYIHMGAYAYSKTFLTKYARWPVSDQEQRVSHELLRHWPVILRAHCSNIRSYAIDIPEDLKRVVKVFGHEHKVSIFNSSNH